MNVREGLNGLRTLTPDSVVSIGNFDGVHLGHQQIIRQCKALRASTGGRVALVTFEPHPLTVLRPELAPPRLTSPHAKPRLLAELGVDDLVVLAPTPEVLNLTAEEFWAILKDQSRIAHLVEGDSFTFGKGRGGTVQKLREWAAGTRMSIHIASPVTQALLDLQLAPVSSSLVRFLIDGGRVRDAALCLGRAYTLSGTVVQGHQRGRTIGIPTANLGDTETMIPADGVYAARCEIDGTDYPTALSIGTMPTFGENARQVEAHLLDFSGDLYGRVIEVEILDWIREQWKLPGIDALKRQIARDVMIVREVCQNLDPTRPIAVIG